MKLLNFIKKFEGKIKKNNTIVGKHREPSSRWIFNTRSRQKKSTIF